MRILIAEDDPAYRKLLKEVLVKWGYDVVVARDGNEAWEALLTKDAPQLAILDWMMPGMEGVEVCRKIREDNEKNYTYIILLTSQQRDEDLVIGMEAGADDYILKPFKFNELRVRLRAGR
jgi:DNA-binding response OmpR family regulator